MIAVDDNPRSSSGLQNLPEGWAFRRIKDIADLRSGDAITSEDIAPSGEYPVYGGNGLRGYTSSYTHRGRYVLIGRQGALCGNINYAEDEFWASEHAVVVSPIRRCNTLWLGETLRAMNLNQHSNAAAQPGLAVEKVKRLHIPVPTLTEQNVIAAYLDNACKAIDGAIDAKRKQLDTLADLRKSMIHKAVTRGLDDSVALKDSSVDWLGKIPAHWRVAQLKRDCELLRGRFTHRPRNDPALYNGDYPFIQTGDIVSADKHIRSFTQSLNEQGLSVSRMAPSGTLVMTIAANIGDVAILDFAACFPDSIVGFVPNHRVHLDFLYYLLGAMKPILLRSAVLTTQLNINYVRIGTNFAAFPPKPEQQKIAAHLDRACSDIAALNTCLIDQIETLHAYRKSLIHECVTGKRRITDADIQKAKAHV
jgi:type I restriction enzyme, S subunit